MLEAQGWQHKDYTLSLRVPPQDLEAHQTAADGSSPSESEHLMSCPRAGWGAHVRFDERREKRNGNPLIASMDVFAADTRDNFVTVTAGSDWH
jgi:hypothetical protein